MHLAERSPLLLAIPLPRHSSIFPTSSSSLLTDHSALLPPHFPIATHCETANNLEQTMISPLTSQALTSPSMKSTSNVCEHANQ